jgi:dipeptidyl aminopeptidase/acylaminoacyl peptidase
LSADGRHAAWLSSGDTAPRLVLFDVERRRELGHVGGVPARVRAFRWTNCPGVGIAVADGTGTENWTLHRLRLAEADWTPLTDSAVQTRIVGLSARRPAEVLVASNRRNARYHDYEVVCLLTGERAHVLENAGYSAVYFDTDFRPRLVETVAADGSRHLWHGEPARGNPFLRVPHEQALGVRFTHFSTDGTRAYFVLPAGGTGTRLVGLRCVDGEAATEAELLFSAKRADIGRVLGSATTGRPEYLEVERFRRRAVALDPELDRALRALRRRLGAEPSVLERRLDGRCWLVAVPRPDAAGYFIHRPDDDELWRLAGAPPRPGQPRVRCRVADVPLRTGERAVTYLTGPAPAPSGPPPAVLLVHGGPWRRSSWEDGERRVRLAGQGFVVLEPNFRGSTGFGMDWVNAGDREWGSAMREDLEDTVDWAVRRGHADPERIALVGGSYGGYAVLQLAASSARPFACVVTTAPLTDLVAFTENPPEPWWTALPMVRRRVGDPADPAQRRVLASRSPINHAASVRCPVLLVHGVNDARVPAEMSTQMFMALARADRDATLALFRGEGHEIVAAGNRRAYDELVADFLGQHLRGAAPGRGADLGTATVLRTPSARARAEESVPC